MNALSESVRAGAKAPKLSVSAVRGWMPRGSTLLTVVVALVVAVALKRHYSVANADELRWILVPTGALVSAVMSAPFVWEPAVGLVNTSFAVAITPACAGVNFLVIAWLTLTLGAAGRVRGARDVVLLGVGAAALSLGITYCVNALRVVIAIHKHAEHRVEGVLVYLTAVCVLHVAARSLHPRLWPAPGRGEAAA